jgi:hypothetical protein
MYRPAQLRFLTAAFLTAFAAFTACQNPRTTSEPRPAQHQTGEQANQSAQKPAPEVKIFVDDAMLRKPYAVLGGSVENVGVERLGGLSVEIELRRRADGSTERREVAVQPDELAPGERGRYSLKVLSNEWGSSRIVRLRSGARTQDVAFQILPGAKRPPERMPEGKEILVKAPRKADQAGEEFINTPDTATTVP